MNHTTYDAIGNSTEVALLNFLQDSEIPIHLHIKQKNDKIRAYSPFSSPKQRSVAVLDHPHDKTRITIYIKGAPELLLPMCKTYQGNAGPQAMAPDSPEIIEEKFTEMAKKPQKVIGMAYSEMEKVEWEHIFDEKN